ncbi:MAG: hypothetical protein ABSD98_01275 [Candidatus Korobacteraceae bacterium]
MGVAVFSLFVAAVVWAQDEHPRLLREAAQCLAPENFVVAKGKQARLAYVVDRTSYSPETVLYVVSYTEADRSRGFVYTVFLEQRDGKNGFNIQNNATFKKSGGGIDFVNAPLGGIWTQEHLVSAIEKIEREPIFEIRMRDVLVPSASSMCESYADKK